MKIKKAIIFDASTLISFAINGLLGELKDLKSIFDGKFFITDEVKAEVIDRPIESKKFELEALLVQDLLDKRILELPSSIGISHSEISKTTIDIMNIANNLFEARGNEIQIIAAGETSCLALSEILTKQGVKNVIAVDERTLRLLSEKPENLKELFERKLKTSVRIKSKNYGRFKGFKFIRSAELVYMAHKKGLIDVKGPKILDALLWAVKLKGCSISDDEIKEIKKLG